VKQPSPSTLKSLGAVCGNVCAFPGCPAPIHDFEHGKLVGQVCHIEAESENGPRYNSEQTDDERHHFNNLMFMCGPHHAVIDDPDPANLQKYSVAVLQGFKRDHESRSHNTIMTEEFLMSLVVKALELQAQADPLKPAIRITPLIESYRSSIDQPGGIDSYVFRVSLRNDSEKTIRSFRLEVEIPTEYAEPTHLNSMRGRCEIQGDFTLYTDTEEGHPPFALFPRRKSDLLMNTDYIMRLDQYKDASGYIRVRVYFEDELVGSEDYSIRDHRNPERMTQLGLTEG
jgi:hypothetical protein